jgi:amino acid adenylation domain-containing protein
MSARRFPAQPIEHRPSSGTAPLSSGQRRLWFLDQLAPGDTYLLSFALGVGDWSPASVEAALTALVERQPALRTSIVLVDGQAVQEVAPPFAVRLGSGELTQPFSLAEAPLWRAALTDGVLRLVFHHAIFDGWSLDILRRELAALLRGETLPPLPVDYADYAAFEQRWLASDEGRYQLAHWLERLDGAPPLCELPSDRPRPAEQSYRGAALSRRLPAELVDEARALGRTAGATLFMTLMAVFAQLLHRHTGKRTVVAGTPLANRSRPELESVIGLFVNTLPLRVDLDAQMPFTALLAAVRKATLDLVAHQELPFDTLVEALNPQRTLAHGPIFQTYFQLEHAPTDDAAALRRCPLQLPWRRAKHDFSLFCLEEPDGSIELVGEYATDLFDAATIDACLAEYETLLRSAIAKPEAPIVDRAHLLALAGEIVAAPDDCLHALVAKQSRAAIAVVCDGRSLTYGELTDRAARLAARLCAQGAGRETRVAFSTSRSEHAIVAMLGILEAGAACVWLDPDLPPERRARILDETRPVAVLGDADTDPPASDTALAPVHPDDAAFVLYTSGSTGRPKGVVLTHRNIANTVADVVVRFDIGPSDRVVAHSSFSFDHSLWEIFVPLTRGATVVMAPRGGNDPVALAALIADERITALTIVPSLLDVLLDLLPQGLALRTVASGGEALSIALATRVAARLPSTALWNVGGPTECSIHSIGWHVPEVRSDWRSVPYGRPHGNQRLYILDDNLQLVPPGVPGELCVGGAGVTRGYLGRPSQTAERFVPDPFGPPGSRLYRTGDRARWRDDGLVELIGRIDRQIKLRGQRIEPGEIEAALRDAGAREAVVVLRGHRLLAYTIGAPDLARLRARLPPYMVPSPLVPLERLPRLPNGKLDLAALPAPEPAAPAKLDGESQQRVAAVFREILGSNVGPDDDFFAFGGHSLAAVRMGLRLGVPLAWIFRYPTVRQLAVALDSAPPADLLPPLGAATDELSRTEARFYVLDQLEPERRIAYLLHSLVPVPPGADADAAVSTLVARHPMLRASYPLSDDVPRRHIAPAAPITLPITRLRDEPALATHLAELVRRPLPLDERPPVRFELVAVGETRWIVCVIHHILCDGTGLAILLHDFAALLDGAVLPPLAVEYAQFAAWQRALATHPAVLAERTAWRQRLQPPAPRLRLPRPPTVAGTPSPLIERSLPAPLSERLGAWWRAHGATPFSGMTALFAALLARYTGVTDVLVGTAESGRRLPGLDAVVGCFVATLPLRIDLSGDPSAETALARAAQAVRFAHNHANVPVEELVDTSQRPFDVFVVDVDLPAAPVGARWIAVDVVGKVDLTLYINAGRSSVELALAFDHHVFDEAFARTLLDDLERIAATVAAHPDARLSELL